MDHRKLSRELVRALRGTRSQAALSRWLGFTTNVVYTWESGRSEPTVLQLFQLAARVGIEPRGALERFYRHPPAWLLSTSALSRSEVSALLEQERGGVPIIQVARDTGISRHSLARYLRAEADIRLSHFLSVLDHCSRRLLDFLALWIDPSQLPTASAAWRRQQSSRRAAYERPWSHAVLRCLELDLELEPRAPAPGGSRDLPEVIAERLGIDPKEVEECLALLEQSQQIRWDGQHWIVDASRAIELSADREAAQKLAAWWVAVAAERANQRRGMFAYNLCSVSSADLQRIADLQRDTLRQIRSIIAQSKPAERVALISVQVFGLDG